MFRFPRECTCLVYMDIACSHLAKKNEDEERKLDAFVLPLLFLLPLEQVNLMKKK